VFPSGFTPPDPQASSIVVGWRPWIVNFNATAGRIFTPREVLACITLCPLGLDNGSKAKRFDTFARCVCTEQEYISNNRKLIESLLPRPRGWGRSYHGANAGTPAAKAAALSLSSSVASGRPRRNASSRYAAS
jgi:hypothetical protein